MSNVETEFEKTLRSCAVAFEEVKYTSRWMPPVGEYTCQLEKFRMGTTEKSGRECSWAKPIFRILDGELDGRIFEDFFWFAPDPKDFPTAMTKRRFVELARCLASRKIEAMEKAYTIIKEAAGHTIVKLRVESYVSKRTGKEGQSVRYLLRVDN